LDRKKKKNHAKTFEKAVKRPTVDGIAAVVRVADRTKFSKKKKEEDKYFYETTFFPRFSPVSFPFFYQFQNAWTTENQKRQQR